MSNGFLRSIRNRISARRFLPHSLRLTIRKLLARRERARFSRLSRSEVFTQIYREGLWSDHGAPADFDSGSGSHDATIVEPYVAAMRTFFERLGKPDVVDLGCGDFAIGSRLRPLCGEYIAADIVEPLIARNRQRFHDLDVDFRVLDLVVDPIPQSDVLMVRQVLQHLGNTHILSSLDKIRQSCRYLVVTEHLPLPADFPPNHDKPASPSIRLYGDVESGVVLTAPPFNLKPAAAEVLCDVEIYDGAIRGRVQTIAYTL